MRPEIRNVIECLEDAVRRQCRLCADFNVRKGECVSKRTDDTCYVKRWRSAIDAARKVAITAASALAVAALAGCSRSCVDVNECDVRVGKYSYDPRIFMFEAMNVSTATNGDRIVTVTLTRRERK